MNLDQIIRFRNFKALQLLRIISILSFLGWGILWLSDILKRHLQIPEYIIKVPEPIIVVAFFSILILSFVLVETLWKWFSSLDKRNKIYKFSSQDWPCEWIFNGKTEPFSISELHIKSSRAGCLLKNYFWKNLKITFEMKFETSTFRPMKNIGLLFRAKDLDNYFMLEVFQDNKFGEDENKRPILKSGIKPHVRYAGGWEMMDIEGYDFDFSDFVKVKLEVKEGTVYLYYKDNLIFDWILPTHVDINHLEAGVKLNNTTESIGKEVPKIVQEIPFKESYGMIGFRAHPGQGAIIRGLKVKPL